MRQNMKCECAHYKNSGLEKLALWKKIAMCCVSGKTVTPMWFPTDLALIDLWLKHLFKSQSCCAVFATPSNTPQQKAGPARSHVRYCEWLKLETFEEKPTTDAGANPQLITHNGRHLKPSRRHQWM